MVFYIIQQQASGAVLRWLSMIFDKQFFLKNQSLIRWFANTRYGKDVLGHGLDSVDLILPNAVFQRIEKDKYKAEFRTFDKYSRRLFYEFNTIWRSFHWFDENVANVYIPKLNLGFDTLTKYPDAHPESTTVDGEVRRSSADATWAAARETAAGTNAADSTASQFVVGERSASGGNYAVYRLFFLFDTSALTSKANISDATLTLNNDGTNSGTQTVSIIQTSPASNTSLATGDFDALTLDSPDEGVDSRVSMSSGDNAFSLNATGIGWISKTGITKLGARSNRDIDDTTPPDTPRQYNQVSMADTTGTSSDPELVVNYSLPSGGFFAIL